MKDYLFFWALSRHSEQSRAAMELRGGRVLLLPFAAAVRYAGSSQEARMHQANLCSGRTLHKRRRCCWCGRRCRVYAWAGRRVCKGDCNTSWSDYKAAALAVCRCRQMQCLKARRKAMDFSVLMRHE